MLDNIIVPSYTYSHIILIYIGVYIYYNIIYLAIKIYSIGLYNYLPR